MLKKTTILNKTLLDYKNNNYPKLSNNKFIYQLSIELDRELEKLNVSYDFALEKIVENMLYCYTIPRDNNLKRALTNIIIGPNKQFSNLLFPNQKEAINFFCERIRVHFLSKNGLEEAVKQCNILFRNFNNIAYCPKYSCSTKPDALKKNMLQSVVLWHERNFNNTWKLTHPAKIAWTAENIVLIFETYFNFIENQNFDVKQLILTEMRNNAEGNLDNYIFQKAKFLAIFN